MPLRVGHHCELRSDWLPLCPLRKGSLTAALLLANEIGDDSQ